jgi:hypothetical protein
MHALSRHALAATVVAGLYLTAAVALAAPKVVISPQLFRTGRLAALTPGNACVLSLTHPATPVQTTLSRASPCGVQLRHAAAACHLACIDTMLED